MAPQKPPRHRGVTIRPDKWAAAAFRHGREAVCSYARPLLVVSGVFLASAGVSFAFGREYLAHVEDERARAARSPWEECRASVDANLRRQYPDRFSSGSRTPTWEDRAWEGADIGLRLCVPLALGALGLTLCAIATGCAFGVVPLTVAAVAGVLPGALLRIAVDELSTMGFACYLAVLSPTLLLTLPAVLLGAAIGLSLGATVLQKHMAVWWQKEVRRGVAAWLRLVLPATVLGNALQIATLAFLGCAAV